MRHDPECIFCRIVSGDIPGQPVWEDDLVIAIRDIQPQAPAHILVLPREHIRSIHELTDSDEALAAAVFRACRQVAAKENLDQHGYRVVTNVGEWGGQTVDHLHFHVLGGRQLRSLG
jgi:histidine triad (HIT) family protein